MRQFSDLIATGVVDFDEEFNMWMPTRYSSLADLLVFDSMLLSQLCTQEQDPLTIHTTVSETQVEYRSHSLAVLVSSLSIVDPSLISFDGTYWSVKKEL